jgi:hypothetical protein
VHLGVDAGTALTVLVAGRRTAVRTLAPAEIGPPVDIPVMAPAELVDQPAGVVEIATSAGLVTVPAQVVRTPEAVVLRLGAVLHREQRREAVRGDVALDVLIAVPDGSGAHRRVVRGRTVNVSAGGLMVELASSGEGVDAPSVLDAEITLSEDVHVPAVLNVVAVQGRGLRTAFVRIDAGAQQELVKLVFARERAQLAARRAERERRLVEGPPAVETGTGQRWAAVLPLGGRRR